MAGSLAGDIVDMEETSALLFCRHALLHEFVGSSLDRTNSWRCAALQHC